MQRLERLVVHIEEALRLARHNDEPHLRLALLLLDSAAELILHRAVESKLALQHIEGQLLEALEGAEAAGMVLGHDDLKRRDELRQRVLSKTQWHKLERYFDLKSEYLVAQGDLAVDTARALRKVHAYRNEAHHRDKVRAGSLRSAVDIYSYLVCTMLRDLNTTGVMVSLGAPPGLQRYLGDDPWAGGFDAPKRIAEQLLDSAGLNEAPHLSASLSAHLLDRLEELEEGLEHVAEFLPVPSGMTGWSAETPVRQADVRHLG